MNQEVREKIALVVFLALIVGTLLGIGAYLRVGHSWNHAATSIDDARGDMRGYTVFVYRGVCVPTVEEAADSEKPVPITTVVSSYQEKGAAVLRLDVLHPEKYDGTDIYLVGHSRVGVFYVPATDLVFQIKHRIDWYDDHDVDVLVCIAEDAHAVALDPKGIDIVISLGNEARFKTGTTIGNTFLVDAPIVGEVGTVIISPENVVAAKDIDTIPS